VSEKEGLSKRIAVIAALPFNFWISNFMEVLERLAFFSTRAVAPLYLVVGAYRGGLGLSYTEKSLIFTVWALIQCLVPMVSGGYTERYGYRKSLALAFLINIAGYCLMGLSGGFWSFFIAGCLVGLGTAIFKPPVQGTIAKTTTPANSSVAWGVFYLVVNIGGFVAPVLAATVRGDTHFRYVFFVAAFVTALNFIPAFLLYREPEKAPKTEEEAEKSPVEVFLDSIATMFRDAHLVVFLLIFSGFWLMFMQLFDTFPNFVDEWMNTRDVAPAFQTVLGKGTVYQAPRLSRIDLAKKLPEWGKDFQVPLAKKGVKVRVRVEGTPRILALERDVKSLADSMVKSAAAAFHGKGEILLTAGVKGKGHVTLKVSLPPGAPQGKLLSAITDPKALAGLEKEVASREGGKSGGAEEAAGRAARLWSSLYLARVISLENGFSFGTVREKEGKEALQALLGKDVTPWKKGETAGSMPVRKRRVHLREDRVGQTKAEMIMNIDTFAIILFMIPIAAFTGLLPPMVALILGMVISLVGFIGAGYSSSGGLACLMIFVFAVGEMTCSPKFSEFIGLIAPPDKKALYMGYSNMPFAIGWAGGNLIAGPLFDALSKKASLAREYLVSNFHFPAAVLEKADPQAMIPLICEKKGFARSEEVTRLLWDTYDPQRFWLVMGAVGALAILGIVGFYFHARKSGWGEVEG